MSHNADVSQLLQLICHNHRTTVDVKIRISVHEKSRTPSDQWISLPASARGWQATDLEKGTDRPGGLISSGGMPRGKPDLL
jgi:hypothetical protein